MPSHAGVARLLSSRDEVAGPTLCTRVGPRALPVYPRPVGRMPEPGDGCLGFISEANPRWRMEFDHNLQANHCAESPAWTGRWFSPKGDKWWPV